jgi:hypothetical protein
LDSIPNEVPYLAADEARVEIWRKQLPSAELRIGIAWHGHPNYKANADKSVPLRAFESLARMEGVQLFSLQKGHGSEEIDALGNRFSVIDLSAQLDNEGGAFLDTAAVMRCLDLIVTIDSSPAHLAGALGVPVWVPLARVPDWRWLVDRDDSPWYPTMRLFRQSLRGEWADVFARIATELEAQRGAKESRRHETVTRA